MNRSAGDLRETGEAWPLWLGFFCFKDYPQQFRLFSNIHSDVPSLTEGREGSNFASLARSYLSRVFPGVLEVANDCALFCFGEAFIKAADRPT